LCFVLLLSNSAFGLDKARSLAQFSYQTWQTGNGLPQNTIRSILQNREGFIWLATEGGLARFDGTQFIVFDTRNTPSLRSNNIRSLLEDEQGSLWIATAEGICRRTGEQFEMLPSGSGASRRSVLALHRDRSGEILALSSDGVARWHAGTGKPTYRDTLQLAEGMPRLTGAVASGSDGKVWLGTQTGVEMIENGQMTNASGNLPSTPVNALLLDHSARLWAGTAKGLFVAEPNGAGKFHSFGDALTAGVVLALFEDWEGSVWLGTDHGTVRLVHDAGGTYKADRALSGQYVIAMAEDAEGDLWMGTESTGMTVARSQKFITYTTRDGLAADAVRCVFESPNGALSIGTGAGVTNLRDGQHSLLTTASGLSSNVILSLGADKAGRLLMGTPDGLNRLEEDGKISVTTSADGLADDFVRSIYKDNDGSLWIGTRRGLSHGTGERRFTTYTQADGLGSELVGTMTRNREGDLWIATLDGLNRFRKGRFSTYRTHDGLSSNIITALYEDAEGELWIGTQNGGLNLLHNGVIHQLPMKLGLPLSVFGISEDLNGELWFSSKLGIARANKNELRKSALNSNAGATVVWYGASDGLLINECSVGGHPEVWKAQDGTLWFSTLKGLAALYPSAAHLNRVLPPVVIESVRIDDRAFAPSDVHEIKPGPSRFAFEYAGLSFVAPQKVIYRYKLEGFDKSWIEAGTQKTAYYTNIPPGNYRFRVLARNNDGFWNEGGAQTNFRLAPHFYQTIWFYALLGLALAGASFLIYRWRVAEVEARFNAVLQERNRIAREIHDTLAQGFVGVSMQLEIVSRLLSSSADAAREHLDQARTQVRESLAEARRSIWQLRSQSAETGDLASRLSKAANQVIGSAPVKLSLEVRGTYRPVRSGIEDELLRIGQEAVTNVLRHADAGRVSIELAYTSKKLRMTITDDGRGFARHPYASGPNGHFGLQGMEERAQQIHARLVVASEEGKGTTVLVEAPLT